MSFYSRANRNKRGREGEEAYQCLEAAVFLARNDVIQVVFLSVSINEALDGCPQLLDRELRRGFDLLLLFLIRLENETSEPRHGCDVWWCESAWSGVWKRKRKERDRGRLFKTSAFTKARVNARQSRMSKREWNIS